MIKYCGIVTVICLLQLSTVVSSLRQVKPRFVSKRTLFKNVKNIEDIESAAPPTLREPDIILPADVGRLQIATSGLVSLLIQLLMPLSATAAAGVPVGESIQIC